MWKAIFSIFGILSLVECDEIYMTSVPASINIMQGQESHLQPNDVSNLINYLLGFSSQKSSSSFGVRSLDVFNRPKGNLFINVILPQEATYAPEHFNVEYSLDNSDGQHLSFLPTSSAIERVFGKQSLLLDFESSNEGFLVESTHPNIVDGLPTTVSSMRLRLEQPGSVVSDQQFKCLSPDVDILFFGELQMLSDIAAKLSSSSSITTDAATDFIYISINSINKLASIHGLGSCQVEEALSILKGYLPLFIESLKEFYNNELLSEVRVAQYNEERVFSRHRRAVTDTDNTTTMSNYTPSDFNSEDFALVINISVWVTVVIALAVLAASYTLWLMDPGRDNIVYRMTMTRMKTD